MVAEAAPLFNVTVVYAVPLTRNVMVPVGGTVDPAGVATVAVAMSEVP
jgi:hypothetical protein